MATACEKKITQIIEDYTKEKFELKLQIITLDETSIFIVIVPLKVLDDIQRNYEKISNEIKKIFKSPLFFIREPVCNRNTINRLTAEKWLIDMCYPAYVACRMTEVGDERIERVFVERKCDFDEEDFEIMSYAYKNLTGITAEFALNHY